MDDETTTTIEPIIVVATVTRKERDAMQQLAGKISEIRDTIIALGKEMVVLQDKKDHKWRTVATKYDLDLTQKTYTLVYDDRTIIEK